METPDVPSEGRASRLAGSLPAWLAGVTLAVIAAVSFATRDRLSKELPRPADEAGASGRLRIVFSVPAGQREEKAFDQLIRAFERERPTIDVKFNVGPGGRSWESIVGTWMAGRNAPDVLWFEDEPFPEFAGTGAFLALDAYIARDRFDVEDFFALPQSEFSHGGVTYAFCQGWGANVLLYNLDLFEERGVTYSDDWTWEDFVSACEKLTFDRDGDQDIDVFGFSGIRNFHHACIPIWCAGGEVLTPDKSRWTLTTPEVLRGFEWWCSLYTRQPPITPLGTESHDASFATMTDPFIEGRVAIKEAAAYSCTVMRNQTRFRWGIGFHPKCPNGPGGKPHRRTRLYADSYTIWDRYPPNWMVNDGLLDRSVIRKMRREIQEHLTGAPDVSRLDDAELSAALNLRKTSVPAPPLAAELLRLWQTEDGRAAMNEALRAEMVRRDAAWELLKYLAGVPGQRLIARLGRSTPGRMSVAKSAYFNREDTPYDEARMIQAIEYAHLQPITPNFGDVNRVFAKHVDRVFLRRDGVFKKLTPREALVEMEKELNEMLARQIK